MSKVVEALVQEEMRAIVLDRPIPDSTNSFQVSIPPPCEACGGPAHGPVNGALACLTLHMRAARSLLVSENPRQCKGCGDAHRSIEQTVTCLEDSLQKSRAREGIGVTAEEFRLNQAQSKHFETSRGKNKKGGGG